VEEHAYLVLVLCLGVAARRRMRMRTLFLLLAAATAIVVVLRLLLVERSIDIFSSTHTRIDGILIGVMLAILYHYAPEPFRRMQERKWIWGFDADGGAGVLPDTPAAALGTIGKL
jgi:peptidoglycan/LPS O-acetylase OafA/YrhL